MDEFGNRVHEIGNRPVLLQFAVDVGLDGQRFRIEAGSDAGPQRCKGVVALGAHERFFAVLDVPTKETRGEHAHRQCKQLLSCLRGSVTVLVDDGANRQEFLLETPEVAVYVPPMVWCVQYQYTNDAILLVLASELYDPDDYIRDYDEFLRERKRSE